MPMTKEAREKIIRMIHDTVDLAALLMIPEEEENQHVNANSVDSSSDGKTPIPHTAKPRYDV